MSNEIERAVITAAEQGDRLGFAAAATRLGSLQDAQALVRSRGIFRMADRHAQNRVGTVSVAPAVELRSADTEGEDGPVMFGHFAVFNEWTEIDSYFEGNFLERIAPGAFRKTFNENLGEMRSLFQHGFDPQIGDKPLGPIRSVSEDETGAFYEVPLLDAGYVRDDILPGLEAGLYGASFRFQMMREDFQAEPKPGDHNPRGLPERTLKELRVYEFGPVTFPAYPAASAGVRSKTELRMDAEDIGTLAEMLELGTQYLDDQDETDDASNLAAMEQIIADIAALIPGEVTENEPPEDDEESEGRSTAPALEDDAAHGHHPTPGRRGAGAGHLAGSARRGTTHLLTRKETPSWVL